jgi:hypothetical protein
VVDGALKHRSVAGAPGGEGRGLPTQEHSDIVGPEACSIFAHEAETFDDRGGEFRRGAIWKARANDLVRTGRGADGDRPAESPRAKVDQLGKC